MRIIKSANSPVKLMYCTKVTTPVMVTIKSLEDFERFKEFTISPICYVYYKGYLSTHVAYVGFTTQHGYKYLKNHHKMKRIEDVLNQGYSIQIYTQYNEDSLIKLLKPSLNKIAGIGICGRTICRNYKLTLGDLYRTTENVSLYKRKISKTPMENYNDLSMKTIETSPYVIKIPMDIVLNILEKYKYDQTILPTFYRNTHIQTLFRSKRTKEKMFTHLFQILRYCKLHCLYLAYVMIHEVYLENISIHVDLYPTWIDKFRHLDNYKKIHVDIVSRLKERQYLTRSILENPSFELNRGPSYYYRLALASLERL